jgi:NADH-quinone oxidoreductase subunit J
MIIFIILLSLLTFFALWSVMRGTLVRAAIALALVSVLLSVVIFMLASPLAAVFELSVCAGLITVVFISTVSLTKPMTYSETINMTKSRISRFWLLPVFVIFAGAVLAFITIPLNLQIPIALEAKDVKEIIWNARQFDLLGQIVILLLGVFGIMILFKDKSKGKDEI